MQEGHKGIRQFSTNKIGNTISAKVSDLLVSVINAADPHNDQFL